MSAQFPRRCLRLMALAMALQVILLLSPASAWGLEAQRWLLQDQAGHTWSLTLLEQADPAYPAGLRLRLTDQSGTQRLNHRQRLRLRDALGGAWELDNRSHELVPAGETLLPAASAQFDLSSLEPRPRAELPLALDVPLAGGDSARLVAGAAAVAALHGA